jgi:hypothetical protein
MLIAAALAAIASAATAQAPVLTQWRPVATPRWAPGAMYDEATAKRKGDAVEAWVRFVDMRDHSPVEMTKDMQALAPKGSQIDTRMVIDCVKPRFRIVSMRITDASGRVLGEKASPDEPWQRRGPRSRGAAMAPQMCRQIR